MWIDEEVRNLWNSIYGGQGIYTLTANNKLLSLPANNNI
jgi:hypothetical protein